MQDFIWFEILLLISFGRTGSAWTEQFFFLESIFSDFECLKVFEIENSLKAVQ